MNITLDQLKEIAKAGSGENTHAATWVDYADYKAHPENWCLEYRNNELLSVTIIGDYVNVNSGNQYFNTLAAIRKMEELGIIEK